MVNNELDEAFALLWGAIRADDPDLAGQCLVALEIANVDGLEGVAGDSIFLRMMEVMEYVTASGACAWHVFLWFEQNFSVMSDDKKLRIKNYVSTNYGKFVDKAAVLEVAEWVGGFQDNWALETIDGWVEKCEEFERYNRRCIGSAIYQLLDSTYGAIEIELRDQAVELSRLYQSKCASRSS